MLRSRRILTQKLNRDPTVEEIARDSGFTPERVRELFELVEDPVSLETPVGDGESLYGDLIEDTKEDGPDAATAKLLRSVELGQFGGSKPAGEDLVNRGGESIDRQGVVQPGAGNAAAKLLAQHSEQPSLRIR
jgi:RNA polymerase primary sigma factor